MATGIGPRALLEEPDVLEEILDILRDRAAEARSADLQARLRSRLG